MSQDEDRDAPGSGVGGPGETRSYTWYDPAESADALAAGLSGRDFLQAIVDGRLPAAPIMHTLGFFPVEVAEGRVVFASEPQPWHYNPIGSVHGGYYGTLLDSCMSCAVQTLLPPGRTYTTVEFKVNVVRGLRAGDGEVKAIGDVVHRGRTIATAEGRMVGADGKVYAHGTATCLIMDLPPAAPG